MPELEPLTPHDERDHIGNAAACGIVAAEANAASALSQQEERESLALAGAKSRNQSSMANRPDRGDPARHGWC